MPEVTINKDSSPQAVRDWRQKYIEQCIGEGKDPKQCSAIAGAFAFR